MDYTLDLFDESMGWSRNTQTQLMASFIYHHHADEFDDYLAELAMEEEQYSDTRVD